MYIENYLNPEPIRSLRYGEKSIGLVVKTPDELEKDNLAGVYIPRYMFGLSVAEGAYEKEISFKTDKIVNSKNKTVGSDKIKVKNYVNLPIAQSGNFMSPRLIKGENVFIESCDKDIKTMYILPYSLGDQSRRVGDQISLMVPNFEKQGESSNLDLDNSYGFQMDTVNKIITIWTSFEGGDKGDGTSNKEKGRYMIAINAADGIVSINDTGKRDIFINSEEDQIKIVNEAESFIDMKSDTITISAKTINLIAEDGDINFESSNLTRKHDEISTTAKKDTESIDTLEMSGKEMTTDFGTTVCKCNTYECTAKSKWKCTCSISGFSGTLTSNCYCVSPNAGANPPPTAATFNSSGILMSGNPSPASLPLAVGPVALTLFTTIGAKVDAIGAVIGIPPTCAAAVATSGQQLLSKNAMG